MTKCKVNVKKGVVNDEVRDSLYRWRRSIKREYYPTSVFAPHAILDDDSCDLLASVRPIRTKEFLARVIEYGWAYWDRHGDELLNWFCTQTIPPLQPLPKCPKPPSATLKPSTSRKQATEQLAGPSMSTPTSYSSSANKRPQLETHPAPNLSHYNTPTISPYVYPPLVSSRAPTSWSYATPCQHGTPMAIPPHMYPPSMSSRAPTSQSCATPHQHQMPTSGSQGSPLMYHTAPPTGFSSPQFMMGPQGFGVGHVSSTDRFRRFAPMPLSSRAYSTPGTITTPSQSLLVNLGLTADFRMPVPQHNVLFEPQSSVPMDLDLDFEASPPIVPSQGFHGKYIP
jgi:hypothetical protein